MSLVPTLVHAFQDIFYMGIRQATHCAWFLFTRTYYAVYTSNDSLFLEDVAIVVP